MLWTGFILGKVPDKDLNGILLHTFWIHIASCLTTLQPYFIQHNLSRGLFWFPCSTVIVNDTAAYFFGRWFGQIPLFSKSPRKTLEGYLAAIPLTLLFGYTVSGWLRVSTSDGVIIALFAAIVAPFGGFFASSLKRANNIKDFGTFLPGHGGLADRVDCQLFMAAFTYFLCSQCEEDS
ncbi:hypothetical protein CU098_010354 [Rhizopus stolonifer]|uniref:Phosphatidate cytidylyltransferase n=1 Tax=Rhizopus stolonifer TaxID=4846 RepID=A0A367JS27_RHIST|nr:hypothetical protein CU098_010354 [Rhizopus stolonifer]